MMQISTSVITVQRATLTKEAVLIQLRPLCLQEWTAEGKLSESSHQHLHTTVSFVLEGGGGGVLHRSSTQNVAMS